MLIWGSTARNQSSVGTNDSLKKKENLSILCGALKVMSLANGSPRHPPWPSQFRNPEAVSDVLCFRTDFTTIMLLIGSQVS